MIPAGALTNLREWVKRSWDTTCEIRTAAQADDNSGGEQTTYPATNAAIQCAIRPSRYRSAELPGAGSVIARSTYNLSLPLGTTVPAQAIIVMANGDKYEVLSTPTVLADQTDVQITVATLEGVG